MSSYLVSDETINVIAWGIVDYGVLFPCSKPYIIVTDKAQQIGETLLAQNYASLGARYGDDTTPHEYKFSRPKKFDEGILLGCIDCYIYQSCETEEFYKSNIYRALKSLKGKMLRMMIEDKGLEIPWGVD